jgi:outer membrane lipoprotein carrier protein
MKQLFLLVCLVPMTLVSLSAQSSGDDAQKILDRASSKLRSAKGITTNFSLTQKDKSNHLQGTAKGVVKIKGNKYYVKEGDNQVFCNGSQQWNFNGRDEVTVSKADNSDPDDLSPQQILSGFSKTDFTSKLISSSGTNYQILLTPIDKRKNFKQVTIFVSKSSNLITKALIIDKSDNKIEITFSNVNLNATLADSEFSFDAKKHPGVEVINQ